MVFFTTTFLEEPKLNPGVLGIPWTETDRPGVVPGRDTPCLKSSSEDEIELLECSLWNVLARLLGTG